jgi:hypothetical protein
MAQKHGSFGLRFNPKFTHPAESNSVEPTKIAVWFLVQSGACLGYAALTLPVDLDSLSIMALFRGLFWFVLFIVLAFCFVVLFEYGPHDFANGFQKEFARVKSFVMKETGQAQKPKK